MPVTFDEMRKDYLGGLTPSQNKELINLLRELNAIKKRINLARTDLQRDQLEADILGLELRIKTKLKEFGPVKLAKKPEVLSRKLNPVRRAARFA